MEALQWYGRLEGNNYDPTLASIFAGEGQVEPTMTKVGPKMVPRGPPELSCPIYPLCGGPLWAHLGLSWALLGPSWGVQEAILRQSLGLEGLILGCKVAQS